jgi:alkylhydroperoxidase/carboxymuconolactone decarboxylase family protein YurZ
MLITISRTAAVIALCALSLPAPAFERLQTVGYTRDAAAVPAPRAPSVLERARAESPLLGGIVEEFASRDLGEGAADGLDDRTREIATAAAFAALGDVEAAKRHATQALRYGATNGQLKEVLYLTAVHAGAPRAIAAARVLEDLLAD